MQTWWWSCVKMMWRPCLFFPTWLPQTMSVNKRVKSGKREHRKQVSKRNARAGPALRHAGRAGPALLGVQVGAGKPPHVEWGTAESRERLWTASRRETARILRWILPPSQRSRFRLTMRHCQCVSKMNCTALQPRTPWGGKRVCPNVTYNLNHCRKLVK